ncbi:MAG: PHP domain-containing protein, partial [Bifidobacteriales bacterium]|nr:PHP domain-containing protein [Bifidobacteriales bacterium]
MTHEDTAKASGWDLHCHTVFSDGTVTPRGMVEQAQQLGLEGLAITDHDTNAGWDQARKAAQDLGMPLLPGTEITAQDGRVSVHMLAYLYDPEDPVIAGLFAKTREARLTRTRTMVERISR